MQPVSVTTLAPPVEGLAYSEVTLPFVRIIPGDVARGFVPAWHFRIWLQQTQEDVGHINFRIGDTDHVRFFAGHIGYHVAEPFRGHRYALKACRALAPSVRAVYSEVIITADPDNHASLRTIERLGAVFVDEIPVPASDPHYARGSHAKRRFLWRP